MASPCMLYDLSTIAGGQIIVRRAKDGDEFQTPDGQVRKLDSEALMICDAEKKWASPVLWAARIPK